MLNDYGKSMKSGLIFALSASFVFLLIGITYAAISGVTATSGETLTASKWNDMTKYLVPSGAIMSFNLQTCPVGWKPSDGTNSTLDLRGQFIRGINSFDNGVTVRSDGLQDPSRPATSLGYPENDTIVSHRHTVKQIGAINILGGTMTIYGPGGGFADYTDYAGTTETRPKNMGVIFCQKE